MAVTNPYYEFTPEFIPGTTARAEDVNVQYQAIQTAFDLLPGDADALTTDTAIFAPESGSGNAYVVTMPDTRTSNQDGDGIRFFATHTNTAAATLNVDGIGAVAFVNWDGDAFVGGEVISGRIYEVRYDATNTQFVLVATLDAALQVEWAEEWAINPEDTPVSVAAGGDGATTYSALHWAAKSLASAAAGRINADIITATPPTTEAVTANLEFWDLDDTDQLASIGFNGANSFQISQQMHGGDVRIFGQNASGNARNMYFADPDSSTFIYHPADDRIVIASVADGIGVRGSSTNDPTAGLAQTTRFYLQNRSGVIGGEIGHPASTGLVIENQVHGGSILLVAEDGVGATQTLFDGDPAGDVDLFYAGAAVVQTLAAASGGLQVNNTLTGAGFERVLTASDVFTANTPLDIIGDINMATPPVQAAFTGELRIRDNDDSDTIATIGYDGDVASPLYIRNLVTNARIIFEADEFGGTPTEVMRLYGGRSTVAGQEAYLMANRGIFNYVGTPSFSPEDPPLMVTSGALEDGQTTGYLGIWNNNIQSFAAGGASGTSLLINAVEGGSVSIGNSQAGTGTVTLYHGSNLGGKIVTKATGVDTRNNSTVQPNTGNVGGDVEFTLANRSGVVIAEFGARDSDDVIYISHQLHGRPFLIEGQDALGSNRQLMSLDPELGATINSYRGEVGLAIAANGGVSAYYDNIIRTVTAAGGVLEVRRDDSVDTTDCYVAFTHANGVERGWIGIANSGVYEWNSEAHGAGFRISGETAGGTFQNILTATPGDNDTIIYSNGISAIIARDDNTKINGSLFLEEQGSALGDVATEGQIWVRNNAPNELWFTDDTGDDYPVATATARRLATNAAFDVNTSGNEVYNGVCYYADGSAYTITLGNSTGNGLTNHPVNSTFQIIAPGSGTITVNEGTSTTLYLEDGTDTAGGCTMTQGAATVFRVSATEYIIVGSGITA
jgi:hypothetical protein